MTYIDNVIQSLCSVYQNIAMNTQKTTVITIRVESQLKQEAEELFRSLGLNLSTACNIFLRKAVATQQIPFTVGVSSPNEETVHAMEEALRISKSKTGKAFENVDDLMKDLNS